MPKSNAPVANEGLKVAEQIGHDQVMTQGSTGFLPVDAALLRTGLRRAFDLYKQIGNRKVLLCAKDYPLTRDTLGEMTKSSTSETLLYVPAEQGVELSRYAEGRFREVLQDRKLGVERRSQILHDASRAIMADILSNPTAVGAVHRGIRVANATVDFMVAEPGALRSMTELFTKDYYTYTHCVHVCVLGVALYKYMVTPDVNILRRVGLGLLLHDTGKSLVDQDVLNKPGRLTDEQFEHMKTHPQRGWEVLSQQGINDDLIRQVVLYHHERVDGAGYPAGLDRFRLSEAALIAAVVDVYDALTTDRPYRLAMSHYEALALISDKMVPDHLDAAYVAAFAKVSG